MHCSGKYTVNENIDKENDTKILNPSHQSRVTEKDVFIFLENISGGCRAQKFCESRASAQSYSLCRESYDRQNGRRLWISIIHP